MVQKLWKSEQVYFWRALSEWVSEWVSHSPSPKTRAELDSPTVLKMKQIFYEYHYHPLIIYYDVNVQWFKST